MADFIIPQNTDFVFNVKVTEPNSFVAQDLTGMVSASMKIFRKDTLATIGTVPLTIATSSDPNYDPALNGDLVCTIPASLFANETVNRGAPVDGYYPKDMYSAVITIELPAGTNAIVVVIEAIALIPTGV